MQLRSVVDPLCASKMAHNVLSFAKEITSSQIQNRSYAHCVFRQQGMGHHEFVPADKLLTPISV